MIGYSVARLQFQAVPHDTAIAANARHGKCQLVLSFFQIRGREATCLYLISPTKDSTPIDGSII